jgi:hypothetical protein
MSRFIELYENRKDFKQFLSLYSNKIDFKDYVYGIALKQKKELKEFFNWSSKDFKRLSTKNFTVTKKTVIGNQIFIYGHFNEFSWKGKKIGPFYFHTYLELDKNSKIVKHYDWINYPNEMLEYRQDANSWIKK